MGIPALDGAKIRAYECVPTHIQDNKPLLRLQALAQEPHKDEPEIHQLKRSWSLHLCQQNGFLSPLMGRL